MPGRLSGRTALIVGGTSGIGLACAQRFLREGASLVASGLDQDSVDHAAALLGSIGPCSAQQTDIREEFSLIQLFRHAREILGNRLDILLHVAGASGRSMGDGPLHECTTNGWSQTLDTNARGVFLTNRLALTSMRAQTIDASGLRGTIINVGSVLDDSPSPTHFATVAYAASKAAIRSLTRSSAAFYAPERIRFQLIRPGLIATPMSARAQSDPAIQAYLSHKQPMCNGPGTPEDVAEAALFLAEPASRFLTGVELAVDGGWSLSEGTPHAPGNLP